MPFGYPLRDPAAKPRRNPERNPKPKLPHRPVNRAGHPIRPLVSQLRRVLK